MLKVALVPVVSSLGPAMPMVAVRLVACLTPGERPVQGLGKVGVLAHPGEQRREGIEVGAAVDDRRARLHLRRPEAGRAAGDGEPGVDGEVLAHPEVGDEDLLVLAHESQPRPAGVRRVRDVQRGEQDVHRAEVPVHELGPVHLAGPVPGEGLVGSGRVESGPEVLAVSDEVVDVVDLLAVEPFVLQGLEAPLPDAVLPRGPDSGADVVQLRGGSMNAANLADRNGPPLSVTKVMGTTSPITGSARCSSRSTPSGRRLAVSARASWTAAIASC